MHISNTAKKRTAFKLLIEKYLDLPANASPNLQKPQFELLCDVCQLVSASSEYQLKKDFYQLLLTVMFKSKNVNHHNYSCFGKLRYYCRNLCQDYITIENEIKESGLAEEEQNQSLLGFS